MTLLKKCVADLFPLGCLSPQKHLIQTISTLSDLIMIMRVRCVGAGSYLKHEDVKTPRVMKKKMIGHQNQTPI